MHAYHLCNVNYDLKKKKYEMLKGKGSLWISHKSLMIKTDKRWINLPNSNITGVSIERKILKILMGNKISVEVNSKNAYIINALYHYIEGKIWQRA